MKPRSALAKELCERYGIPYRLGKGMATIDGVPVNQIQSPIFAPQKTQKNVQIHFSYELGDSEIKFENSISNICFKNSPTSKFVITKNTIKAA